MLGDPLGAFVDYGVVLAGEEEPGAFVTRRAGRACSQDETTLALELLELKSHLLSALTSCAWFFADPTGIETLLALRHAALVLDTSQRVLGIDAKPGFLERLEPVRSNTEATLTGRELWTRSVEPHRSDAKKVAAGFAMELAAGSAVRSLRRGAWLVTARTSSRLSGS